MAEKKRVVVPFPDAGRATARDFRGRDSLAEAKTTEVPRESVLAMLDSIAPLGKDLEALLNVPDFVFPVGSEGEISFSSKESDTGAARAAGAILKGFPFPSSVPDYGIHMSSEGSSLFCTLVDRSRKIIVSAEVRNLESEEGSWKPFEFALRDALSAAESFKAAKTMFDFVVNKEGIIRAVKL